MHDLLDQIAPEVDVEAAWEEVSARLKPASRGRSVRVLAVAAAVALVGGGALLATRSGSRDGVDTAPTDLGPGDTAGAVTVDVPPGWERAVPVLTLDPEDTPELLAIGTFALEPNGAGDCPQLPIGALNRLARPGRGHDAFIWVAQREGAGSAPSLDSLEVPDRPADDPEVAGCLGGSAGFAPSFAFARGTYERDGTDLEVLVALGTNATAETRLEVRSILDSLHLEPDLVTHRSSDGRFLVNRPADWAVSSDLTDSGHVLTVGTGELRPDEARCPTGRRCINDPCRSLADLGPDDALVWFESISTAAIDFAHDRQVLTELPEPSRFLDQCAVTGRTVGSTLFPAGGDGGIAVYVAVGVEVTEQTRAQALAVINSVRATPRRPPVGLRMYEDPSVGLAVGYPSDWDIAGNLTAPVRRPANLPEQIVAIATYALRPDRVDCDGSVCHAECIFWPVQALADLGPADGLIWVTEDSPPADDDLRISRVHDYAELPSEPATDCPPPSAPRHPAAPGATPSS